MVRRYVTFTLIGIMAALGMSCVTSSPYTVSQPAQKNLMSVKTVLLDIGMAERAIDPIPLLDAGIYKGSVNSVSDELKKAQEDRMPVLNSKIFDHYKSVYSAEIVKAAFPFEGDGVSITYFKKPTEETRRKISSICAQNNAEMVLAIVG